MRSCASVAVGRWPACEPAGEWAAAAADEKGPEAERGEDAPGSGLAGSGGEENVSGDIDGKV
ncbi:MAG: hypothetical protein ACYS26_07675, partial [Planctomycetota bacterium]